MLPENATLHGQTVHGVSVLGSVEDLKSIIDSQSVSALILASPHLHRYRVYRAISVCQERGIPAPFGSTACSSRLKCAKVLAEGFR